MTELELNVRQARTQVNEQQSVVEEARLALEWGTARAEAELTVARADCALAIQKVQRELERELIKLERETNNLAQAEAELERGFE